MKFSPVSKSVATACTMMLLATACADESNSPDGEDSVSSVDNIPASQMRDWDVDCDWFHLDDLHDFLDFEEWQSGPIDAGYGSGSNPDALTCEGTIDWPEFDNPDGLVSSINAIFRHDVYPFDSLEEAEEKFDERVEQRLRIEAQEQVAVSESIEGNWLDSRVSATHEPQWDSYYTVLHDDDFVMVFDMTITSDPHDSFDETDVASGERPGIEFDRETAADFLFEEQMPNIHDEFVTLLKRKQ